MTEIPPEAYPLFDEPNFAHVATLMPDGSPQTTPVWVDRDGGIPRLNTAKGRVKHRNLVRDPRIALSVHMHDNGYHYVQVRGETELVDAGAADHIESLSRKYLGRPYPGWTPGEERVIILVHPTVVDHHPPAR